tara:strand:- start:5349 stop:6899 length:1551 start_codon:yes stop_codon:yes gene_type:complete
MILTDTELQKKVNILTNKLKAGLFQEVINEAKILLKKRKHQVLFNLLSLSYQSLGENNKSIEIMEIALKANSRNPHFLNNIGLSHFNLRNFKKAENYFKRGLDEAPKYISILNNLGSLKSFLNLNEEAISYYQKILEINDKLIEPYYNLAINYEALGQFKKSIECLEKILKLNPKFTQADRLLSNLTKYHENHSHYKNMRDKIENMDLSEKDKSHLYFAMGKYFEDIKNYEKSFQNYSNGNKIIKKTSNYKTEENKNYFKKIKNFNYDKLNNYSKNITRKIIFIVGMPRSSTSLIEQILSSHKEVFGGGELAFLESEVKEIFTYFDKNQNLQNDDIQNLILNSRNKYLEKISNYDNSTKAFTDKAPLNFRYIGFIKFLFPNSKIVHCTRDPLDVTWSNFKNYFSNSMPFTNDLKDIANFYKSYKDIMIFWKKKFPQFVYDIEYSNLVENSENEIKRLLNFCELNWDENCLNHHENNRAIKTASSTQARKPIYKTAIKSSDRYKNYLKDIKYLIESN